MAGNVALPQPVKALSVAPTARFWLAALLWTIAPSVALTATMALFLTSGFPRRKRVVVVAIFAFFIWAFLPIKGFNPPRRLLNSVMTAGGIELASSTLPGGVGAMLRYVDPLIGTVNGGQLDERH